jgi:hypothetical protein
MPGGADDGLISLKKDVRIELRGLAFSMSCRVAPGYGPSSSASIVM